MRRRRKRVLDRLFDELLLFLPLALFVTILYLFGKTGSLTSTFLILGLIVATLLAFKFYLNKKRKQKLMESGIHLIDSMTGEMFEELILEHYKKLGYKGKMTPTTGDYGADLILDKDGERIVAQVKRWERNVGIEAVQQIIGAIKYYHATRGMVICNRYFTENALRLADSNNIELWDRDILIDFLSKARGKALATKFSHEADKGEICPRCGYSLTLRSGRFGEFWGCLRFPKCRYTKPIDGGIEPTLVRTTGDISE